MRVLIAKAEDMLTERRQQLLRFIVDEYVRTAQPVASGAIVHRYHLPVSSATIRNEMARLEDEGYIVQPHTSAGRAPTDKGYRYYVEALMRPQEPPAAVQQTIRHQCHHAAAEAADWPQLVALRASVPLRVLVPQEPLVVQHTLPLAPPLSQDELSDVAGRLNSL